MLIDKVNSSVNLTLARQTMNIANMGKPKRNITDADRHAGAVLTELWKAYKLNDANRVNGRRPSEGFIAEKLGMTQSMFNQLKNATVTWGLEHAIKIGDFFGKDPRQILPSESWGSSQPSAARSIKPAPKPDKKEPYDFKKMFADDTDGFLDSLMYCWPKLSKGHKDALSTLANTLYIIDNPNDPRAKPQNLRRRADDKPTAAPKQRKSVTQKD